VTGAEIAAGVGRIGRQADRTAEELSGLEGMIRGSSLGEADKSALLRHVSAAQAEAGVLAGEVARTGTDVERLNAQLARQREISAALSEEHDRREADGAAVKEELAVTKEKLAKTAGQRDLAIAVAAALALGVIGYAAIRVLRFLKIIPV
jgi:hypothetical protein